MHTITYVSTARIPYSPQRLLDLLTLCRENNLVHGITGMLLYRGGVFMQAIEGPKTAVERLYANIRRDPAHTGIITLLDEPVEARDFAAWEMGFADISNLDMSLVPGFVDFFRQPRNDNEWRGAGSHAKALLHTFRDRMG
ncbi:MAG TPA: BLUF domain-containing protein [Patescibacteria group bacterium]|nr:BLUF domain-containing protein [Patescibacteria group bacterium]